MYPRVNIVKVALKWVPKSAEAELSSAERSADRRNEVYIDMYDDRLEIFSPGGLMDGGSIKDMDVMNMASRRRNPVLADIFSRLKYMERRGSGFKKIVSAYKGHDGYTEGMDPTFLTPWDSFVLTLPKFNVEGIEDVYISNGDDIEDNKEQGGQKGVLTTETTTETIRLLIKNNPSITGRELAEKCRITEDGVAYHIKKLKLLGKIKRMGGTRNGGYWEIVG